MFNVQPPPHAFPLLTQQIHLLKKIRAKAQSFLTNSVLQPFTVKRGGDYVLYYATLLPF